MAKGSSFEREVCKQLGLWWSNDERDDIFWRTAGSGAMATMRRKTKKKTFGQSGDIQATDPIGQPLIDACSIELKRGYNRATLHDIADASLKAKQQQFETFMNQAKTDADNAGAPYWLLITKRDRRQILITMPFTLYKKLRHRFRSCISCTLKMRHNGSTVFVISLWEFLAKVQPDDIRELNS